MKASQEHSVDGPGKSTMWYQPGQNEHDNFKIAFVWNVCVLWNNWAEGTEEREKISVFYWEFCI